METKLDGETEEGQGSVEAKARSGTVLKGSQRTRWRAEDGRESWKTLSIRRVQPAGEVAQSVNRLPCKHEDLSSILSTHIKANKQTECARLHAHTQKALFEGRIQGLW